MKGLTHRDLERERELKKIVKSLSKVSEVDTKDIRKDIYHTNQHKMAKRAKFVIDNDVLLNKGSAAHPPLASGITREIRAAKSEVLERKRWNVRQLSNMPIFNIRN